MSLLALGQCQYQPWIKEEGDAIIIIVNMFCDELPGHPNFIFQNQYCL